MTKFYTFGHTFFCSHFLSYVSSELPDTCGLEYAKANMKKVETMLFKELKIRNRDLGFRSAR